MQKKCHERETQPSQDEELPKVLDEMEPMASTPRRLGFSLGHGIAKAELKRGFSGDINAMFRQ